MLPARADGTPEFAALEGLLGPRTRAVALHHVSNVLGTIAPVAEIARLTRARGIPLLVDGAQAAGHLPVDVAALGCDFYAFSGHKLGGPTGVGVLYAREAWLERLVPYQWGGGMVARVDLDELELRGTPHRFEAGTPNIAGFAGLGAAVDFLEGVGMEAIHAREAELLAHLTEELDRIEGLRIFGRAPDKAAVVSFAIDGTHSHDLATLLDLQGVAVRSGQHCAHPLLQWLGVGTTCRASLAFYNTHEEIEAFVVALRRVRALLG